MLQDKRMMMVCVFILFMYKAANASVGLVKESYLQGYDRTTVGEAFDAAFDKGKWSEEKTVNGIRTVVFTGYISQRTHDTAAYYLLEPFANVDHSKPGAIYKSNLISNITTIAFDKFYAIKDRIQYFKPYTDVLAKGYQPGEAYANAQFGYDKAIYTLYYNLVKNQYWTVGSAVKFTWTLGAGGAYADLTDISNDSWAKTDTDIYKILDVIYTTPVDPATLKLPSYGVGGSSIASHNKQNISNWLDSMIYDFKAVGCIDDNVLVYYCKATNGYVGLVENASGTYLFGSSVHPTTRIDCVFSSRAELNKGRFHVERYADADVTISDDLYTISMSGTVGECGIGAHLEGSYEYIGQAHFKIDDTAMAVTNLKAIR